MAQIIGYDDLGDPIYDTPNGEADRSKENNTGDLINRLIGSGTTLGTAALQRNNKTPANKTNTNAPAPAPQKFPLWIALTTLAVMGIAVLMFLSSRRSGPTA